MRKSLTQLVAATGLLAVANAFIAYAAPSDYSGCQTEVKNILGEVEKLERRAGVHNRIGARVAIRLTPLTQEQQACVVKGIVEITKGAYNINSETTEASTMMYFTRNKPSL